MPENVPQTPIAVRAICIRCEKPFSYYVRPSRGQTKAYSDFEYPMLPVCSSCRSRGVQTGITTNRSEEHIANKT